MWIKDWIIEDTIELALTGFHLSDFLLPHPKTIPRVKKIFSASKWHKGHEPRFILEIK